MNFLFVTNQELSALMGLPYIQQSAYLIAIRPYMDRKTFIVGKARKISYQSIAEALYIEPHQGFETSGSPSRQQLRRVITALEKAGLIQNQSVNNNLILKCLLAEKHHSVQNKPDTNPTQQLGTQKHQENIDFITKNEDKNKKADTVKNDKPDTPHNNKILFIFLRENFEKFWSLYPLKKGELKAWDEFVKLNPSEALISEIQNALESQIHHRNILESQNIWLPSWKYPANWLAQKSWKDELFTPNKEALHHETHQTHSRKKSRSELLTELCEKIPFDFEDSPETTNVLPFERAKSV